MMDKTTGIILAGGRSTRMGEDKSFVSLTGKPMVEIVIDRMSRVFRDLIIIANKPDLYRKYGIRVETDIMKECGPLGGIHTGLFYSVNNRNFVVACDMPFLEVDLMRHMVEKMDGCDAVMAERNGKVEPLCAGYSRQCLAPIERELHKGNYKMTDLLKHINAKTLSEKDIGDLDPDGRSFININTKEEYQCILKDLQEK